MPPRTKAVGPHRRKVAQARLGREQGIGNGGGDRATRPVRRAGGKWADTGEAYKSESRLQHRFQFLAPFSPDSRRNTTQGFQLTLIYEVSGLGASSEAKKCIDPECISDSDWHSSHDLSGEASFFLKMHTFSGNLCSCDAGFLKMSSEIWIGEFILQAAR